MVNLDIVTDVIMLLAAIIGLLGSLFRYVEIPKKGWLLASMFFLSELLSDYYWTTYTIVMHEEPDVSAFLAYFGWNIGYAIIFLSVLHMRSEGSKRYFNPLMLLPVPLNLFQFFIYIRFGGLFNNIWQVGLSTLIVIICLQSVLYYLKEKKNGEPVPYFHCIILFYILTQYVMWTASCYDWYSDFTNPYYYSCVVGYITEVFFAWAINKTYKSRGLEHAENTARDTRFQARLEVIISGLLLAACVGGYLVADWMKKTIPQGTDNSAVLSMIAVILFMFSIFLCLIILALIYIAAQRYKYKKSSGESGAGIKRGRINLFFTIIVTLGLMVFTVIYNSRLFYRVSLSGIYTSGEDKAANISSELDNYLAIAQSSLNVTADTIDLMLETGESEEKINNYLVSQTTRLKSRFDENFTGVYGYIRGEFLDGSGWIPPEGYDARDRDWYSSILEADGKTIIVSPYVDAHTGDIVITIGRLLRSAGGYDDNIVCLDVTVGHVQDITEEIDIAGNGYAMIINSDGLIVTHKDRSYVGTNIRDNYGTGLLETITNAGKSTVETDVMDEKCTLFTSTVMDQWHVVIVVRNRDLFEDAYSQLTVNILVSLTIFVLVTIFYFIGYKNEQAYGKKVEEMKSARQKQQYEADVLRLEKASADEANKAKSNFLADMSHEIRTPINAILGMNEMILRETREDSIREYSGNIRNSGKNLLQLVNSILDFSKIEDGKMEIVPVRYSLSTLITYLVNSVQERAEEKKLEFKVCIDPDLPSEYYGDDARINQVVLNLLTNAVKYTHEGSVTLTVKCKEVKDGKALLYFEVADTGIGIKESDMDKLFESFERLDVIRNRTIEGTGLGMSIATKLLSLMDSKLGVKSIYGQGSVFSFDLWQKIENNEPIGEYKIHSLYAGSAELYHESFHAPKAKILVVDDTRMNIIVVVNLLKKTGVEIDTAPSGEAAVKLADEFRYDLILLDQRMPGMDGTQTLKIIRDLDSGLNKDTPIICLTADAIRGAKERYIAEGFNDYLTKPVEGKALEKMLITYLPKDKVEKVTGSAGALSDKKEEAGTPGEETASEGFDEILKAAGIDTEAGIGYAQGDKDFYRDILKEYASEYPDHSEKLIGYYNRRDWDNYSVMVHAVKSTSRTIGAGVLADLAAKMEAASKDRDISFVENEHKNTLDLYEKVADAVKKALGSSDESEISDDDDEIMEFAPTK
jgi:signal transduction histidine kinase/CheY-like chemotaxis protein/HPt (histidine-containing phosphotransfer) domain-containing protein